MREAAEELGAIERQIAAGHFLEAARSLQSYCDGRPGDAHAWFLLGACHHQMGDLPAALDFLSRSLALAPGHQQAALATVAALCQHGRADAARIHAQAWLEGHPDDDEMRFSLGLVCESLADDAGALAAYDGALALTPAHAGALQNRGIVLSRLGRTEEAVQNNRRLVQAFPQSPDAHFNLAESCLAAHRYDEVIAATTSVLTMHPRHAAARLDRGYALAAVGRIDDARQDISAALTGDDGSLRALYRTWVVENAFADPTELEALLQPEDLFMAAGCERLERCDWIGFEAFVSRCADLIATSSADCLKSRGLAFKLLNLPLPAVSQKLLADRVAQGVQARAASLPRPPHTGRAAARPSGSRIRLGFLSGNFIRHPTSHQAMRLFGLHDRSRFEVFGYALTADDGSDNFSTIKQGCDQFRELQGQTAQQIGARIAADAIDILVDMNGYTRNGCAEVMALRPAPVQASYVAYPSTMGGTLLDYLIVDATVIPPAAEAFYSEKMARLPHCYLPNRLRGTPRLPTPARSAVGLPERGFVFCAFHRAEKIEPRVFATWMRILQRVPDGVLWLQSGSGDANLARHAAAAGIARERLVFAPFVKPELHLARWPLADLYLDTLYANAHTQGADALWSGVPLITFPGEHWVARVGASLLNAVGLEDCITGSLEEYEALACELALNPGKLAALKARLAHNRDTHPLFDTASLARNLDAAYLEMWRIHQSGEAPRSFAVQETAPS